MKRFFIMAAVAILSLGLTACKDNGKNQPTPEATFEFELTQKENKLSVKIVPSIADQTYVTGILRADEYAEVGGTPSGIVKIASEKIGQEYAGEITLDFEDLWWNNEYVVYAAQVVDGVVYGTPAVSEKALIYRETLSFIPSTVSAIPTGISDNGRYIVGSAAGTGAYIYDIYLDELVEVEGEFLELSDITDDGVAFGSDNEQPCYYKDGKFELIPLPTSASTGGHIFSVTPDGKKAVGYVFENGYDMKAFVYDNGTSKLLEMGKDYFDVDVVNSCARGVGTNGYICGYVIGADNNDEECCLWTPELKYELYSAEYNTWNDESGWFRYFYGSMFSYMSPSGRYIGGFLTDFGEDGWGDDKYSYVYDTQEKKMHSITASEVMGYRPDAVAENGLLFLSQTERGLGLSPIPYCYDINDKTFSEFGTYLKTKYDYSVEDGLIGSVLCISSDCKIYVTGSILPNGDFQTNIYFLR